MKIPIAITAAQNTVGAGTDTLSSFENLTGSAFADHLTGSAFDNVITGGAGGYFLFDNSNAGAGTIYWDATGGSSADAVAIAKISGTTLSTSDFHII